MKERSETGERKCNETFYKSVTEGNTDTTFFTNTKFKSLKNVYIYIIYIEEFVIENEECANRIHFEL